MQSRRLAGLLKLGLVIVLGGLLSGCATTLDAEEVIAPDVSLVNITPVGGGLFEQRVEVTLRVTNLNDFDLPIEGTSFQLDVNGSSFARGVSREAVVVPALGEATVTAEATTSTLGLIKQLRELQTKRSVNYALSGRFSLDGLHVKSVSFDRAADLGEIPFMGGGAATPQ